MVCRSISPSRPVRRMTTGCVQVLLSALPSETMLLADRGYDADWIRELARQQGAWANIPPKRNRKDPICFSPYLYRARNLIERFFNKIKQCRRVATRYDKLAANYLAFIKLVSIRIWLRANESTPLISAASGLILNAHFLLAFHNTRPRDDILPQFHPHLKWLAVLSARFQPRLDCG
jgi:transposase